MDLEHDGCGVRQQDEEEKSKSKAEEDLKKIGENKKMLAMKLKNRNSFKVE